MDYSDYDSSSMYSDESVSIKKTKISILIFVFHFYSLCSQLNKSAVLCTIESAT